MKNAPSTIDEYLAALPTDQQEVLEQLRATIAAAVPDAQEAIKTGVPAIRYKGKTVVSFGAARQHVSLYVMYGAALKILKEQTCKAMSKRYVSSFPPGWQRQRRVTSKRF
jgi:uncharacterized protein YdhG (YjbR/CyaY superfamily)